MQQSKLVVVIRSVDEIRPYPGNARVHSKKQVEQIAASIRKFGCVNPILVDENDEILAGHGRWLAAQKLGLTSVPTIKILHLKPAEKVAFRIADNRIAELSTFSKEALAIEFTLIASIDADFDVEITGFDLGTIELLIDKGAGTDVVEDEVPLPHHGPAVTRRGDCWDVGRHRLVCGDATLREPYLALMGRSRAQMVFSDPPYNVPINGHVSGNGKVQHREFVAASGEMSRAEFTDFLTASLGHMARFSIDGALAYICMDWRHLPELHAAGAATFDGQVNLCVWNKRSPGLGSLYRSQHELVAVFKRGTRPHINNVELGKHGRNRSNVWNYPGVNSFSATRADELAMHPTVKPLALVADAILDASRRDGLILDPFGGSGTTLLAAEQTGRRARLLELDPLYCDVIIRRAEAATGLRAADQHGRTFAERLDSLASPGEQNRG